MYVDDRLEFPNQLHVYARMSERAHARIVSIDTSPCYQIPGVAIAITAKDVPGQLDIGAVMPGDPLLADGKVEFIGQPVIAVAADSPKPHARRRWPRSSNTRIWSRCSTWSRRCTRSTSCSTATPTSAATRPPPWPARRVGCRVRCTSAGRSTSTETQVSSVMPTEDGGMIVYTSTQNPTEVQKLVAEVLGVPMNKIVIDMRRMGGGFGGKETQAAGPACLCAVIAHLTGRPTKMRLPRMEDMTMTGKRHPFYVEYDVGFDDDGLLHGIEIDLAGNCGYSPDLSGSIVDRAMFHSDNAYYRATPPSTAIAARPTSPRTPPTAASAAAGHGRHREIMDAVARELGKDLLEVRKRNYYGKTERNVTHYYQTVEHNMLEEMTAELEASSDYAKRREDIRAFNAASPILKKGLALTPVKFGISFTASFLNRAGALVHVYTDGSIHLNHGGTEMGQA